PSHITGRREMIRQVSQQALDLNYDGLMIETHPDPDNAWSDAAQQVTPSALKEILAQLVVRKPTDDTETYIAELEKLRTEIDSLDSNILEIIGKRMAIADRIGTLKKEKNVAILQSRRWREILEKMIAEGRSS